MKKIFALILVVVLGICVMSGCADKSGVANQPQEKKPFFEEHGLYENFEDNGEEFVLEDGVGFFYKDFSEYYTGPAKWTIKQGETTDLGDGFKEIHFTVKCSYDKSEANVPKDTTSTCNSGLYDYYTGIKFSDKHNVGNKTHNQNEFSCTFEVDGKQVQVDYSFSIQWQGYSSSMTNTMTKEYVVRCPEDYDGLVFCAVTQPDNVEDFKAKRELEDGADDYVPITECRYIDAHKTLRCRIK